MSYNPTVWKDRVIEKPNTFTLQNNPDGTITLIPVTGVVTEVGTPVNAANLNKMENWIQGNSLSLDVINAILLSFVGSVSYFAMASAPSGWLAADGSAVSRTTYANLFAKIGTTFGVGDGSTTFNLPDLRGSFIRGLDNGKGYDSGRTLGSYQADDFKSHNHTFNTTANLYGMYSSGTNYNWSSYGTGSAISINNTGGTETRPKNVALLACIKY